MNKREEIFDDDDILIEMTDDEGNVFYCVEEMIISVDGENFALLVEVKDDEHEHEAGCGCGCGCEDDKVILVKIVVNEDGFEEYVEPTEEELAKVQEAYEKFLDEEA